MHVLIGDTNKKMVMPLTVAASPHTSNPEPDQGMAYRAPRTDVENFKGTVIEYATPSGRCAQEHINLPFNVFLAALQCAKNAGIGVADFSTAGVSRLRTVFGLDGDGPKISTAQKDWGSIVHQEPARVVCQSRGPRG